MSRSPSKMMVDGGPAVISVAFGESLEGTEEEFHG